MTIKCIPSVVLKKQKSLDKFGKSIKRFTFMKIIDAVMKNPKQSRKEHLLRTFEEAGKNRQ